MELAGEAASALSGVEATPEGFRAELCVPAEASVLAGHFPGHPVVPAVYLIEACVVASSQARGSGRLLGIRTAKFLSQVLPEVNALLEGRLEAQMGPEGQQSWILDVECTLAGERAAVLSLDLAL